MAQAALKEIEFEANAPRPDPLEVFILRTEARAMLAAHRLMTLHEAVDELWCAAEAQGLVRAYGVDVIQGLMAQAFEPWAEYFRQ